jgi:histone deacetylase complex regulatory component SIN3
MTQWRKKNEERLKRVEEERREQDRIIEKESLEKLKVIYNKLMKEYYL